MLMTLTHEQTSRLNNRHARRKPCVGTETVALYPSKLQAKQAALEIKRHDRKAATRVVQRTVRLLGAPVKVWAVITFTYPAPTQPATSEFPAPLL